MKNKTSSCVFPTEQGLLHKLDRQKAKINRNHEGFSRGRRLLIILIFMLLCREDSQPTPVFLPGKSHGQRSLVGCSSWGCKELDMTEHTRMHRDDLLE